MANFDTSNLLTAQTMLADRYKQPEMRMKPAPAFTMLSANANIAIVGVESLKTRDDRPFELHFLTRTKRSSGSARAHNHTGTIDDSAKITPTWTTKSDKCAISLKLLDKSVFDFNTVLANKLEQACMNVLEDKETEAIAYLMAQRATQQPATVGEFNTTTDAVEIAAADIEQKRFFAKVRSIMRRNYFSGQLDVIVDPNLAIEAEFLAAQGGGNATNYGYQFGGLSIAESVELSDADYANGTALVMPTGSVAALNWIPKQNRMGWGDYNDHNGGYGVFNFMGYQFALHGYAQRADTSAANGDTQDVQMEFEVSLDTSFNKAPIVYTTGRTDSVIHQFGQLS